MTEEEAYTKWCPYAGKRREERGDEFCVGPACMAWRLTYRLNGNGERFGEPIGGYCGLAGKP